VTTEEVGDYLRESTVTVLPCIVGGDGNVDALPTVLLEAMATARPLVSTALSGIPEIIDDGENGYLVEPDDVAGLADALARLFDDPERAAAMGVAGRKKAERLFSLKVNAGRLRDMLRQGLQGGEVQ
jgi:glycosyltransferase involved in cell wall biosynthesis